jgi:flagellar hook assembly protein FlgD
MKDNNIIQDNEMIEKLKKSIDDVEKQMSGQKSLIGAKHLIWDQIITTMNQFRIYFDVLQQNGALRQHVQIEINKLWSKIEKKALVVDDVIIFLNSKPQHELTLVVLNYENEWM